MRIQLTDELPFAVAKVLFDAAMPTVQHFRGDFYRDVHLVDDMVTEDAVTAGCGLVFFYSYDDCGTYLSTNPVVGLYRTDNAFVVHVYRSEGKAWIEMHRVFSSQS